MWSGWSWDAIADAYSGQAGQINLIHVLSPGRQARAKRLKFGHRTHALKVMAERAPGPACILAPRHDTGRKSKDTRVTAMHIAGLPLYPAPDAGLPEFVALLKKLGYQGICSLHSEYKGKHSFKDLSTEECLRQTAEDLAYFTKLI